MAGESRPLPSGRVSVLVEQDSFSGHTGEVGFHQEVQKLGAVDRPHGVAQALKQQERCVRTVSQIFDCILQPEGKYHTDTFDIKAVFCSPTR